LVNLVKKTGNKKELFIKITHANIKVFTNYCAKQILSRANIKALINKTEFYTATLHNNN